MKNFYKMIKEGMLLAIILILMSYTGMAATHFTSVWQGENGQNHMNFLVVSAILEDLPLLVDDELAVFSGSNCVGVTKLTKAINPLDNTTFLAISASQDDGSANGFTENDVVIFKIWDNKNQKEMVAKAVTYRSDASTWSTTGKFNAGATSVVELVFYVELTQTINLIKGYNMISTYVTPQNPDVSVVTQSLVSQGAFVKMQDEAGLSYENWGAFGGWINKIGSMQKTEGYKLKVASNCSLVVTGRPIVLPLDIPLKAGWNIISFPHTDAINALSVVQSLIDANKLVKVQDESGNSIENWGVFGGWKNGIGNFVSGKAYKVKMNADATLTMQQTYLRSAVVQSKSEKTEYYTSSVEGNGSDHMNINLVDLQVANLSVGDEMAVFDGKICVGTLKITEANLAEGTASLIASFSTNENNQDGFVDGNQIQIYSWNKKTGNETQVQSEVVNGQLIYEKNASVLVKMKSLTTGIANLDGSVKIDVFPNPSIGKVNVRFSELPEVGSRIDILDLSGRKVTSRLITGTSEVFNLCAQPAGIYVVKLKIGSNEIIHKVVINK